MYTNSIYSMLFPYSKRESAMGMGEPDQSQPMAPQPPPTTPIPQTVQSVQPQDPAAVSTALNSIPNPAYSPDDSGAPGMSMTGNASPDNTTGTYAPSDMQQAIPDPVAHHGKQPDPVMPNFQGTPDQIEYERQKWLSRNAPNQDHGFKGRMKEILSNFIAGMGGVGPNANWAEILGAGAGGAGVGTFDRTLNERRAASAQIPRLQQQIQFDSQQATAEAQRQNMYADNQRDADTLNLKKETEANRNAYWNRKADLGDLKQATAQELVDLRDKWAGMRDATSQRRLNLVEKEMENRNTRAQNALDSRETVNAANNASREKIVGQKVGSSNEQLDKKLASADEHTKLTLVTNSLNKWRSLNPQATPEQLDDAEKRIRATVYKQ